MRVAARRDGERSPGSRHATSGLAGCLFGCLSGGLWGPMVALSLVITGCGGGEPVVEGPGTGGRVEAGSDDERRILAQADALPAGEKTTVGSLAVVADEPYFAASGRTCRWLTVFTGKVGGDRRLACKDQRGWFFAPDVLGPPLDAP